MKQPRGARISLRTISKQLRELRLTQPKATRAEAEAQVRRMIEARKERRLSPDSLGPVASREKEE